MKAVTTVTIALEKLLPLMEAMDLNERQRREFCGFIASEIGYGGVSAVSRVLGMSPMTVRKGTADVRCLSENNASDSEPVTAAAGDARQPKARIRRPGGGRKSVTHKQPGLMDALVTILEESSSGDPMRAITWTTLSLRDIQGLLVQQGFKVSHTVVGELLRDLGYGRQVNQKMGQLGEPHPDRDAQFRFVNEKAKLFVSKNIPVISVDCKKKESIGDLRDAGAEYRIKGDSEAVPDNDFEIGVLGDVAPSGLCVVNDNAAFINLGASGNTAEFSGESIARWWHAIGAKNFTGRKIYVVCDGGGNKGCSVRLWKFALAKLAEEHRLEIHVSHLPPGTSKWDKVEHRLFCYTSQKRQGQPLIDIETVVSLISPTDTNKELKIDGAVDHNTYFRGINVSDDEFEKMDIEGVGEFGNWNYIVRGFKPEKPGVQ